MRRLIAVIELVAGIVPAALAASSYSDYTRATRVARFFRDNPEEVPITAESRDELMASSMSVAGRNRSLAVSSGTAALAFAGGVAWIIPGRVANVSEINALVAAVPGPHERRRA
jgi:hypothetical protein